MMFSNGQSKVTGDGCRQPVVQALRTLQAEQARGKTAARAEGGH
ncbi:hypothetical protein [Paraburkholderia fungorum]|nr:hypothetical protein [Paraburkholderia fungorum]